MISGDEKLIFSKRDEEPDLDTPIDRELLLEKLQDADKSGEGEKLKIFDTFYHKPSWFKRLNARPCLAIEIGGEGIYYLLAKRTGDFISVEKWGFQPIPREEVNRHSALKMALETVRKKIYRSGQSVYVSFFSPDINVRQLIIPEVKRASELKKAIFYQLKSDLPSFSEEDEWTYQILDRIEEEGIRKVRLLVTVVSAEVIARYLDVLNSVGIKPDKLVPRPLATVSAYRRMVSPKGKDMVIDITPDYTQVIFLSDGQLVHVRNIALGSNNIQKAIRNGNGTPTASTMLAKESDEEDSMEASELSALIRKRLFKKMKDLQSKQNPVLQMLLGEILRSIEFIKSSGFIPYLERVFLTGEGVLIESVVPYLRNRLSYPVYLLIPQFREAEPNRVTFAPFLATVGTALQGSRDFNLVPKSYRLNEKFKNVNRILVLIIVFVLTMLGLLTIQKQQQYDIKVHTLQQYSDRYEKLNPVERIYNEMLKQIQDVRQEKNSLLNPIGGGAPVIEVMKLFSNETPEEIVLTRLSLSRVINKTSTTQKDAGNYSYQIVVIGKIQSDFLMGDVILINFLNRLDNLGYFKQIKLANKHKEPTLKIFEFEVHAYL